MEGLFGGHLIGVKGQGWICFYNWDTGALVLHLQVITNSSVRTAKWVGDVCIYTTNNRLQYLVGEQSYSITHIDPGFYLLGYIARDGRVYLTDKDVNVISYALSLSVVEYQMLVLRGDMDAAESMLATIPANQMPKIVRFLEGQGSTVLNALIVGYKEKAMEVSMADVEQRFELALQLNKLDVAYQLAERISSALYG